MNNKTSLIIIWSCIFTILFPVFSTIAEELDSTNFKIVDITTQGGGTTKSTNYSALLTTGESISDPTLYSTNYKMTADPASAFRPAVPTVSCFETATDGYSNCTTGPAGLSTGGMVSLCGGAGCYDRARFEIGDAPYQYDTSLPNLVSYWPMDETTGNIATDVKGSNDGTVSGTTIIDGKYRKARKFNGTSDYIQVPSGHGLLNTDITVSMWIYPTSWTNQTHIALVTSRTTNVNGLMFFILSQGNLNFDWGNSSSNNRWNTGYQPPLNEWTHIVFSRDSSGRYLYVNGSFKNMTSNAGGPTTANTTLRFGSDTISSQYFYQGEMDEILIFNSALSLSEVEDLYKSTRPTGNPSDTLYAIQISEDNFSSDIRYIDGSTYNPKEFSAHNLNDFRTKSQWESDTYNILGLSQGTQYYLRIVALHGNFTQTEVGPIETATTAGASSFFDIDIAGTSGTSAETNPPFSIAFTGENSLLAGAGTVVADNLIWMDAETNGFGGFAIIQRGDNGGLYSATKSALIESATGNLDTLNEGFGLQNYYINYNSSSSGTITAMTNYSGSISNVGIVYTEWNKIYDADGPIVDGRMALYLMARANAQKQGATDYNETITFVFVPRY